jgi:hypothetical protein
MNFKSTKQILSLAAFLAISVGPVQADPVRVQVGDFDPPDSPVFMPGPIEVKSVKRDPFLIMGPSSSAEYINSWYDIDDLDETPELKKSWQAWHKKVDLAVNSRLHALADLAFKKSPPLSGLAVYLVSADRSISNVVILKSSKNKMFDNMMVGAIKSLSGSPILEFPPGSKRQLVEKLLTFEHNSLVGADVRPVRVKARAH